MIDLTEVQIGIIAFACKTSVERLKVAIADANVGEYERLKDYGYCVSRATVSPQQHFEDLLKRINEI
jgi:hypothetical protein